MVNNLEQKRFSPRFRKRERVTIMNFDGETTYKGTLVNISRTGAMLAVKDPEALPDQFDVMIKNTKMTYQCQVIWRDKTHLGIAFMQL